jgi:hypothetical protein
MAKRNNNTRRNNRRGGRRNGLFTRVGRIPSAGLKVVDEVTGTGLNLLVNIPTSALKNVKQVIKNVKHSGLSGVNRLQKGVFSGADNVLNGVVGVVRTRKNKRSRRASRRSRKVGGRRNRSRRNNSRKNNSRKSRRNNSRKNNSRKSRRSRRAGRR